MATSAPTFLFEIEELRPKGFENRDQSGFWFPPDKMSGQFKIGSIRRLYYWNGTINPTVTLVPFPAELKVYKQVTMYYSDGRFWVVPYDATQRNVSDVPPDESPWLPGWKGLTFEHCPNGVSSVGFEHPNNRLATQRPNLTWRPQLFPEGCAATGTNNQRGGLQGNLALILALGAFSAPPGQMADAIAASFRLGQWVPHILRHGREHERGLVVTVYLDPPSSAAHLEAFENGLCGGPIFV